MAEPSPAVIRDRPLRVHTRNKLADFDALVERALVAQYQGRGGTALLLVDEAAHVAGELIELQLLAPGERPLDFRAQLEVDVVRVKRRLSLAIARVAEVQLEDAQVQAENAKRHLRRLVGDDHKRSDSLSGRPLW